jgi:hypothetical protein
VCVLCWREYWAPSCSGSQGTPSRDHTQICPSPLTSPFIWGSTQRWTYSIGAWTETLMQLCSREWNSVLHFVNSARWWNAVITVWLATHYWQRGNCITSICTAQVYITLPQLLESMYPIVSLLHFGCCALSKRPTMGVERTNTYLTFLFSFANLQCTLQWSNK